MDTHERIIFLLDLIIVKERCILSWDQTLIEQLPDILIEQYGISSVHDVIRNRAVAEIFDILDPHHATHYDIYKLPELLIASGLNLESFSTRCREQDVPQNIGGFSDWTMATADGTQSIESILSIQKTLGKGENIEDQQYPFHLLSQQELPRYLHSVSSVPVGDSESRLNTYFWGVLIEAWKLQGWLDSATPSLSIGPRWATEILYFREVLGLPKHIGVDLHTEDPTIIVQGDMHSLPFPDNSFGMVFLKNIIDKSYNLRLLIDEIVRVLMPGGIVITDHDTKYQPHTPLYEKNTPFTRIEIQEAQNLLKVFSAKSEIIPLVCENTDISELGKKSVKYNARAALRVLKGLDLKMIMPKYTSHKTVAQRIERLHLSSSLDSKIKLAQEAIGHLQRDDNQKALDILEVVVPIATDVPILRYVKAVAEARLGMVKEARTSVESFLHYVPDSVEGRLLMEQLKGN